MKFFTKEAFIIKTSKNEQDFFTFLDSKCEKLSLFSQDTKGIFFKRTKKHILFEKNSGRLISASKRIFKCEVENKDNLIILKGNFVFKPFFLIFMLFWFAVLLFSNFNMLIQNISCSEKIIIQSVFFLFYIFGLLMIFSGKQCFKKEEKELIEFLKRI